MKRYNLSAPKIVLLVFATLGNSLRFTHDIASDFWGIALTVVLCLLFAVLFDEMEVMENVLEERATKEDLIIFFCCLYIALGTSPLILFGVNPPQ